MRSRSYFHLPALYLFLAALAYAQAGSQHVALTLALGELNNGKILDAIGQLKQIVRTDPGFAPPYFYLSRLYLEMGELPAAESYLERALSAGPEQGGYYHQLGLIRFRQKKWREALALFERALRTGAENEAIVWRNAGDASAELFDRERALEAYENSLQIQPNDARTRLALGRFYLERNESEKAVVELRAAVALKQDLPGAWAGLGRAYRRLGDLTSTVDILKKAVTLDPADQESRYGLAQALLAMGREDEGRKELETHQRLMNQAALANRTFEAGRAKQEAQQLAEAERLLESAVALAPAYSPALYSLGTVLLDRGKPAEAARALERAAASNAVNSAIHFRLGTAYFRSGKPGDALEATRRALVLDEENAGYHRQMGEIYMKLGRAAEGREALDRALELESRHGKEQEPRN